MSSAADARPAAAAGRGPAWLAACAGLAGAAVLIALAPDLPQPLRALSAPAGVFAPGYGLLAVMLRRRDGLETITRLALSAILSLALIALTVVAVDPLVPRLDAHVLAHAVGGLVLVFALLVGWQRGTPFVPLAGERVGGMVGGFAVLVVAVIGVVAASISLLPAPAPIPYFRFGLDGAWAALDRTVAPAGPMLSVSLLLKNQDEHARTYTIVPTLKGARPWKRQTFVVPANTTWHGTALGPVPTTRRCFNRMALALRQAGKPGHVAVLTFYVKGTRAFCPSLPVTPR